MRVNQWVPAAHRGDAIGDSARLVSTLLRALGHEAHLFALTIDPGLEADVLPFDHELAKAGDVTILHYALPSRMTEAFAALPRGRVLQYHNITPAHFFADYDPHLFRLAVLGRRELATLVGRVDLALGDSAYNCDELREMGFSPAKVMPIAVPLDRLYHAPDVASLRDILDDGLCNFLFVGRVAPNKRLEDHLRLAEYYKRYVGADYRFVFVGRYDGLPRYHAALQSLMLRYRMLPERFLFTGPLSDAELATCYRLATAYLSLSEHEGFCVPLVEAMAMDVPVVAYRCCAVPDTLGPAGLQFEPKDLAYAAELLGLVARDENLRARLIAGQRRRVADFSLPVIQRRLAELLARFQ